MTQKIILILVGLLGLGLIGSGCRPQEDDATPVPVIDGEDTQDSEVVPLLILKADALTRVNGSWQLDETSVNLEERGAGLVLTARYANPETGVVGALTMTRYHNADEAKNVYDERLAAWQNEPANTVESVAGFGLENAVLNSGQSGIVLADESSIAEVAPATGSLSTIDALTLLQVGVEAVLDQTEPDSTIGYLGNPFIQTSPTEESN